MRTLFLIQQSDNYEINQCLQDISLKHPDLIILSADPDIHHAMPLHKAKGLLGHTLNAIALDIRQGFPLDYFLCIANTIQDQGTLYLIGMPNHLDDEQSNRFHTQKIATPNFQHYLNELCQKYGTEYHPQLPTITNTIQHPINLTPEQQIVLETLKHHDDGVLTLFASRGTGKSYVVAEFLRQTTDDYIITAPNQNALNSYLNIPLNFKAPDDLFLNSDMINHIDWLIIDEAAQMPIAHLEKLSHLAPKVLLISSVDNYEGTGKGLVQKLENIIHVKKQLTLSQQHRFNQQDDLSLFCESIQLNHKVQPVIKDGIEIYDAYNLNKFQSNTALITAFYQFMNQHHYQTNAQDIRRLFDSPQQLLMTYGIQHKLIAGTWCIQEGELTQALSQAVYHGYRRPKGNLVVQTLSAHSYYPHLMQLKSLRISRIAVDHKHRHHGIAKNMLLKLIQYARENHYDFLSTSFGLTDNLLSFWQQCGFTWVHMGTHRDKTTGLHACIMIYPLTTSMNQQMKVMQKKWCADAYHLQNAPFIHAYAKKLLQTIAFAGDFDALDDEILHAHAHHKKPQEAVYSAKIRQASQHDQTLCNNF